jgi:hypothetical protein
MPRVPPPCLCTDQARGSFSIGAEHGEKTMITAFQRRARARWAGVAVGIALLVCGCKNGAVNGPGGDDHERTPAGAAAGNGNSGGSGSGQGGGGGGTYGFGLPSGPTSGTVYDGEVYNDIRTGRCTAAQQFLDDPEHGGLFSHTDLLRIGIALCRGDLSAARSGLAAYHWPGTTEPGQWFICELYRASASVVYQRPRPSFATCPAPPVESPDESTEPSGPVSVEPSAPVPSSDSSAGAIG